MRAKGMQRVGWKLRVMLSAAAASRGSPNNNLNYIVHIPIYNSAKFSLLNFKFCDVRNRCLGCLQGSSGGGGGSLLGLSQSLA